MEEFEKFGFLEKETDSTNLESGKSKKSVSKKYPKPESENECVEYFKSKNYYNPTIEGVKFFHYHNSKGWKIGKNPVVNWHSAAAYWNRNNMSKIENKKKYVEPNKGGRF